MGSGFVVFAVCGCLVGELGEGGKARSGILTMRMVTSGEVCMLSSY